MQDELRLGKVERTTLKQSALERLRSAIVSGALEPGTRLVEAQLAAELGVSRAPIREALHELEQDGLIASRGRGFLVRELHRDDLRELCALRLALERAAVEPAVQRITATDLDHLERILERLKRAPEDAPGRRAAAALDADFHEQLIALSGYPRVHRMWRTMRHQFNLAIHALDVPHRTNEETAREHEPILAALRARDVEAVEEAVTDHIQAGLADLLHAATPGSA